MEYEPSGIEMLLTRVVYRTVGKSVYKGFADMIRVPESGQVLDLGSGFGTVAYYLLPRMKDSQLTCVDISERWLALCKKTLRKYNNVSYQKGNIAELSLPHNSFDIIYSHFVLHDIPDTELKLIIPALMKLLKSGGIIYIREPLESEGKINQIKQLLLQSNMYILTEKELQVPTMGLTLDMAIQKK